MSITDDITTVIFYCISVIRIARITIIKQFHIHCATMPVSATWGWAQPTSRINRSMIGVCCQQISCLCRSVVPCSPLQKTILCRGRTEQNSATTYKVSSSSVMPETCSSESQLCDGATSCTWAPVLYWSRLPTTITLKCVGFLFFWHFLFFCIIV